MANVEAPYNYKKAVLHALAAQRAGADAPSVNELTAEHAAAAARTAAADADLARDVAYGEQALAEKSRQAADRFALDREKLDAWAGQNRWATAIAAANLGISGLAIPVNLAAADKQEAHQARLATLAERNVAALEAANRNERTRQDTLDQWLTEQKTKFWIPETNPEKTGPPEPERPVLTPEQYASLSTLAEPKTRRLPGSGLPALYRH